MIFLAPFNKRTIENHAGRDEKRIYDLGGWCMFERGWAPGDPTGVLARRKSVKTSGSLAGGSIRQLSAQQREDYNVPLAPALRSYTQLHQDIPSPSSHSQASHTHSYSDPPYPPAYGSRPL